MMAAEKKHFEDHTIDERMEELLTHIGGKYKLVSLFQKRLRELQRGMPVLIETDNEDPWDVVTEEIMSEKVDLLIGDDADKARRAEFAAKEQEEKAEAEKAEKAEKEKSKKEEPKKEG